MKIFLSWSGELSHKIACAYRDWLPSVLQHVKPYVSSEDIDKGARWSTDIAKELEASTYGIMCITSENLLSPWINFEAGALSKTIEKSRVSPFLFDLKRSDVHGPLLQFQSTVFDKDDIAKLVLSINNAATADEKLDEARLLKGFGVWWPILKDTLDGLPVVKAAEKSDSTPKGKNIATILEELLDLVRNQQKLLRSPEQLFPAEYLEFVLKRRRPKSDFTPDDFEQAVGYLMRNYKRLQKFVVGLTDSGQVVTQEQLQELRVHTDHLEAVIRHLARDMKPSILERELP
jgi:hypothetical protein